MGVVRRHRPAACELADPDRAGEDGHEAERDQSGRHQPLPLRGRRHATLALADEVGIEALSMRTLAERLGVVPMALYKHVANKDELLDGMVDVIVGEIEPPAEGRTGRTPSGSGSSRPGARCSATAGRRR